MSSKPKTHARPRGLTRERYWGEYRAAKRNETVNAAESALEAGRFEQARKFARVALRYSSRSSANSQMRLKQWHTLFLRSVADKEKQSKRG